jgi:hypothetical protein
MLRFRADGNFLQRGGSVGMNAISRPALWTARHVPGNPQKNPQKSVFGAYVAVRAAQATMQIRHTFDVRTW